jgi:UDP-N-acetylmuramyl pentapeptide phosphotransferase/UDP-N-acetylglucosamine-1-phosphate transferase
VFEFAVSLVVTLAALPLVVLVARWRKIVDIPNERSSHVEPIHRGGGLACLAGVVASLVAGYLHGGVPVEWKAIVVVIVLAFVGFLDDVGDLPAVPRLVAQLAAGGFAGWYIGRSPLWLLAGVLVLAATVNAVNFMDGIDGITGLTVAVWCIFAILLARSHHATQLLPIGAVTLGAAVGFLPANLPKARLFLGDVGSYFFGGLIGLGLLIGWHEQVPLVALAAPLSVYLTDTGFTLIRRALHRMPLLAAHREHVYQRLVSDSRFSHPIVAAYAALTSAAISGCWYVGNLWLAVPVTAALLLIYLASPTIASKWRTLTPPAST